MWKDFFSFNKRERFTLVTLTVLIVLMQVLIWTQDAWVKFLPTDLEQKYQQKKALAAYRDSVNTNKPNFISRQRSAKAKPNEEPLLLVPFNPNTADSVTLRRLGLRSYVVKNILNYRRKGGVFRKPADFARIYGLEPNVYASLEKLIRLEAVDGRTKNAVAERAVQASVDHEAIKDVVLGSPVEASSTVSATPAAPNFDLNSADTSMLQQLKGVGSFTASRITKYRNQLGGFYALSQLSEVKGLYPETLARLQSMMTIDPTRINKLNVNKASLEKLRAHPYLSFYQAKVIVELRKTRGGLRSLDELSNFEEFKPQDLERLKWYLSF